MGKGDSTPTTTKQCSRKKLFQQPKSRLRQQQQQQQKQKRGQVHDTAPLLMSNYYSQRLRVKLFLIIPICLIIVIFSNDVLNVSSKMRSIIFKHEEAGTMMMKSTISSSLSPPTTTTTIIPKPLQMLKEYQKYHSQDVIMGELNHNNNNNIVISNKTFVIGLYSCPDSAGNRMHEFFSAMITAIAHNYTLVWKFYDGWVCRKLGNRNPKIWCKNNPNTIGMCDDVVERASWMTSYDNISEILQLDYGHRDKYNEYYSVFPNDNKVWIPIERNLQVSLREQLKSRNVKDPIAIERYKDLYSEGTYYLYGMLMNELFPFRDSIKPSKDLLLVGSDNINNIISIVLHSRHTKDYIDGTDVHKEIECIENILSSSQHHKYNFFNEQQNKNNNTNNNNNNNNNTITCNIFLLSDRQATLDGLANWIHSSTQCHPVIANHDMDNRGQFKEHGPFALKGFFQDLALASYANGGYIGAFPQDISSSAELIRELYEYNHFVLKSKQQQGNNTNNDNAMMISDQPLHCRIPKHNKK